MEYWLEKLSGSGLERSKITSVNTNKMDFYKTCNARNQKSEKCHNHKFCLVYILSFLLWVGCIYCVSS